MVFYSKQSRIDLREIFDGLLKWSKHQLEYNHVMMYHHDILDVCRSIDTKTFHFNTQFEIHKQFGQKVLTYRRNKQTTWYIIYNLDIHGNVFIQRLFSNHTTTE